MEISSNDEGIYYRLFETTVQFSVLLFRNFMNLIADFSQQLYPTREPYLGHGLACNIIAKLCLILWHTLLIAIDYKHVTFLEWM